MDPREDEGLRTAPAAPEHDVPFTDTPPEEPPFLSVEASGAASQEDPSAQAGGLPERDPVLATLVSLGASGMAARISRLAGPLSSTSTAIITTVGLVVSTTFIVLTAGTLWRMPHHVGPWVIPPLLLVTLLPVVIGVPCFLSVIRRDPTSTQRWWSPGAVRLDEERIASRTVRWVPLVLTCTVVQALSFHLVLWGSVLALLLRGEPNTLPPTVAATMTMWVCVQVSMIMAMRSGLSQAVRLSTVCLSVVAFHLVVSDGLPVERMVDALRPLLLLTVTYASQRFVLEVGQVAGSLRNDRRRRAAESDTLHSAVEEAGRIEDLIHDNILSCLLLTSRGGAEDEWASGQIKHHAATALRTLDEIANPTPPPTLAPLSAEVFTGTLVEQVRLLDPSVETHVRGRRRGGVPAEVSHALTTAALEAVRNSLRHADGALRRGESAIHRSVRIVLAEESVSVEVEDDGVGFDPELVPPRAMGMRGSILRRVQRLPGGHAGVASAPMRGTVVQMSWTDLTSGEESQDRPTGGLLRRLLDARDQTSEEERFVIQNPEADDALVFQLRDPRLTVIITAVLGLTGAHMLLTLPAYAPWWPSVLAFGVMCLSGWFLCRTWSTPSGAPPAWMWPYLGLTAPAMLALTLPCFVGVVDGDMSVWTMVAVNMVLVILALSRYDFAAVVGLAGSIVLWMAWGHLTDQPQGLLAGNWPTTILAVLFCSVMGRWATSRMAAAAELQSEREHRIAASVEQAEVLRQRRSRSHELDVVVRPLITRLASDEEVTPEMEMEAGLLESRLRDDMRARCFHGTDVARAAWDARARGVFVELMDDGGLTVTSTALKEAVISVVAGRIDQAVDGQITVRVLPSDREVVASVLHRPAAGSNMRTEIFEDGRARTETA